MKTCDRSGIKAVLEDARSIATRHPRTGAQRYHLYKANPEHASLNFKPLKYTKNPVWSVRINDNYRALALRTTDDQGQIIMLWFWIGNHREYDKVTERL